MAITLVFVLGKSVGEVRQLVRYARHAPPSQRPAAALAHTAHPGVRVRVQVTVSCFTLPDPARYASAVLDIASRCPDTASHAADRPQRRNGAGLARPRGRAAFGCFSCPCLVSAAIETALVSLAAGWARLSAIRHPTPGDARGITARVWPPVAYWSWLRVCDGARAGQVP